MNATVVRRFTKDGRRKVREWRNIERTVTTSQKHGLLRFNLILYLHFYVRRPTRDLLLIMIKMKTIERAIGGDATMLRCCCIILSRHHVNITTKKKESQTKPNQTKTRQDAVGVIPISLTG